MIGLMGTMALHVGVQWVTIMGDMPGSDKLMRLTVDRGDHTSTILAAIRQERAGER